MTVAIISYPQDAHAQHVLNAPEAGASMENDTKDPYSDNSDTN